MTPAWPLMGAVTTGCLVLLLWRPPPLERLRCDSAPARWQLPVRLRPRPDAMAGRTRATLGAAAGGGAYLWASALGWQVGAIAALGAGLVAYLGLGQLAPASAARRHQQLLDQLPHALRLVSGCVGAGLPLRGAVAAVSGAVGGEVGARFDQVLALIAVGVSEPDAWLSLGKHPVVGPLARDLARAVDSGAAVQTVLSHRANEIQSERRAAVEARAKAVGVRTVIPLGLCFLPAFLLLGIVPVVAGMLGLVLLP